jgi:hypothetical protein
LYAFWREWISKEKIEGGPTDILQRLNYILLNKLKNVEGNIKKKILQLENRSSREVLINNYGTSMGTRILSDGNSYELYKTPSGTNLAVFRDGLSNKVYTWLDGELSMENRLLSWEDIGTNEYFRREMGDITHFFENNKFAYAEKRYHCETLPATPKEDKENDKIGVIDLEAYVSSENNRFVVYAAGFAVSGMCYTIYVTDKTQNQEYILSQLFSQIFKGGYAGYTFYCHNLGMFDGPLLINGLSNNSLFDVKGYWRPDDNSVLSLRVKSLKNKKASIKIMDSLQLLNSSLESLLKAFNCNHRKSHFPYEFMNNDRLFYKGPKPDISLYPNISVMEYNNIPNDNWDAKEETLSYLKRDLEGLLEVILKFSNIIFTNYGLNITAYQTLPSLAMALFTSNFISPNLLEDLKLLPKGVSQDIRNSYYGGLSFVFKNHILGGHKYDQISQYPHAMLNGLPGGDPTFSTDPNLEKYYGFVFAKITPPKDKPNRLIQLKVHGRIEFPESTFTRWISTVELKSAKTYGFSAEVICGYKFTKEIPFFTSYVNTFFSLKANAEDPVIRNIAKLFLNTLHGKFGANYPVSKISLIKANSYAKLEQTHNIEFIGEKGKYVIVKNWGLLPLALLELLKSPFNTPFPVPDPISDSLRGGVHLASYIAACARTFMHPYIYHAHNPVLAINTDGFVVQDPLPLELVGTSIGKLKLEHNLAESIFIYPKLYYLKTIDNLEIIKSAGLDHKLLNYQHFLDLLNGKSISLNINKFELDLNSVNIKYTPYTITLSKIKN